MSIGSFIRLPSGKQLFVEKYDPSIMSTTTATSATTTENLNHHGDANKTPIVFIHGLVGSTKTFHPIISNFPNRTRILYDIEGHARSSLGSTNVNHSPTLVSLTQDILDILEFFGLECKRPGSGNVSGQGQKVDIVAYSAGTIVALQFAKTFPDMIGKLVLLGPVPLPMGDEQGEGMKVRARMIREKGLEAVVPLMWQVGPGEKAKNNPEIIQKIKEESLGQDGEGVARVIDALSAYRSSSSEEARNVDTVVISGEEDKMSDLKTGEAVAKFLNAKFVTISTGHSFTYEDPQGVIELLSDVL